MAKYGVVKYGAAKYGKNAQTGAGSITSTGGIIRLIGKLTGSGSLSIAGALTLIKAIAILTGEGAVGIAGSVAKSISKFSSGTLSIAGSVIKSIKIFAGLGTISSAGGLIKTFLITVSGAISTITGSIVKTVGKNTGLGSVSISGVITRIGTFYRTVIGTLTPAGSVIKSSTKKAGEGIAGIAGTTIKSTHKAFSGTISNITGTLGKISQFVRNVGGGSVSIQGILSKLKYYFLVTIDSILQPLGIYVLGDSRKDLLLPSVKEYTDEIPGHDGEIAFDSKYQPRLIELHVATTDEYDYTQREAFKRLLASYLNPKTGAKNLIFEDDPDKYYLVKYSGKIDITQYANWFDFVIPFKMVNPYIFGVEEKSLSGSGTIINNGNVETPVVISIAGAIVNPSITLGTYTLSYTGTISAGQTLVIDTENRTVKLNGINVLNNYTGGFPKLQPGNTNVTASSQAIFIWRERWV